MTKMDFFMCISHFLILFYWDLRLLFTLHWDLKCQIIYSIIHINKKKNNKQRKAEIYLKTKQQIITKASINHSFFKMFFTIEKLFLQLSIPISALYTWPISSTTQTQWSLSLYIFVFFCLFSMLPIVSSLSYTLLILGT